MLNTDWHLPSVVFILILFFDCCLCSQSERSINTVLHEYGHPIAKYDLFITRATQNVAMDGPVGD